MRVLTDWCIIWYIDLSVVPKSKDGFLLIVPVVYELESDRRYCIFVRPSYT